MTDRVYRPVGYLYCGKLLFVAALVPTERGRNLGDSSNHFGWRVDPRIWLAFGNCRAWTTSDGGE
ncbi:MAG TPA: hypothetical protein DCQ04_08975 [Actinobacteria bacterium]|nr:hypothetical protein [Actinomycetota bacterium]